MSRKEPRPARLVTQFQPLLATQMTVRVSQKFWQVGQQHSGVSGQDGLAAVSPGLRLLLRRETFSVEPRMALGKPGRLGTQTALVHSLTGVAETPCYAKDRTRHLYNKSTRAQSVCYGTIQVLCGSCEGLQDPLQDPPPVPECRPLTAHL